MAFPYFGVACKADSRTGSSITPLPQLERALTTQLSVKGPASMNEVGGIVPCTSIPGHGRHLPLTGLNARMAPETLDPAHHNDEPVPRRRVRHPRPKVIQAIQGWGITGHNGII